MIYEPLEPTTQPTNQQPRTPHPSNGPRLGSWITSWHSKPPEKPTHPTMGGEVRNIIIFKHTDSEWGIIYVSFPGGLRTKKTKNTSLKNRLKNTCQETSFDPSLSPVLQESHIVLPTRHSAPGFSALGSDGKKKKLRSTLDIWRLLYLPQQICPGIVGPSEIIKDSFKKNVQSFSS